MALNRTMVVAIWCGLLAGVTGCSRIPWRFGPELPLKESARTGRPLLVYFFKAFDSDCEQMDHTVFTAKEVQTQVREMIPVRLDAAWSRKQMEQLGVREVPAFVVVSPRGAVLRRNTGPMDIDKFLAFLVVAKLSQ